MYLWIIYESTWRVTTGKRMRSLGLNQAKWVAPFCSSASKVTSWKRPWRDRASATSSGSGMEAPNSRPVPTLAGPQHSNHYFMHFIYQKKSNRFQKSSRKFGINRHANKHLVECSDNLHCSGEHDQYRGWLCILACHLQNVHASVWWMLFQPLCNRDRSTRILRTQQ